jgi:hypothetical protein
MINISFIHFPDAFEYMQLPVSAENKERPEQN